MDQQSKVLYTAKTQVSGGREHGAGQSSDGQLNVKFSSPGSGKVGTNPEQLFAAGWSACFESAIGILVQQKRIKLSGDVTIDAEVDLNLSPTDGYSLTARLRVHLPAASLEVAQALVDEAHKICPYSKATRGNIKATITVA